METRSIRTIYSLAILAGVMLFVVCPVKAVNVEFRSDAIIRTGDIYDIVSVYDTPPEVTTVHMFGGSVYRFFTYNSSTVNIFGGELERGIETWHSSTVNIYGGTIFADGLGMSDSSTVNIYGGDVTIGKPYFNNSCTLNIYGYGFNYEGYTLRGFLSDNSPFEIIEFQNYPQEQRLNLIVIPDPSTVLLLGLGALFFRKRK